MGNKAGTRPNVHEAIQQRARELADQGPAFTAEQMILLRAVFSHRGDGGR